MAASSANIPLHAAVRVGAGQGIVRFVGQTSFAAGKWVGIELDDEGTGKNDGTVQVGSRCIIVQPVCNADALRRPRANGTLIARNPVLYQASSSGLPKSTFSKSVPLRPLLIL